MSQFEDTLWESVLDRHGEDLARGEGASATRRTRPRVLAGATVAVAASATAVTLLVSATASPPAFAVTRQHDGSVSVKILRSSGITGANRELAAMGVPVRARFISDAQTIPRHCTRVATGVDISPAPVARTVAKPETATTVVAKPETATTVVAEPEVTTTVVAKATVPPLSAAQPKHATTTVVSPNPPTVLVKPLTTTTVARPRVPALLAKPLTTVVICTTTPVPGTHRR